MGSDVVQQIMQLKHTTIVVIKLALGQCAGNSERLSTLLKKNGPCLSTQQSPVYVKISTNPQPRDRQLLHVDRTEGGGHTCMDSCTGRRNRREHQCLRFSQIRHSYEASSLLVASAASLTARPIWQVPSNTRLFTCVMSKSLQSTYEL